MPLLNEWKIGDHALAAIWKVEEPEEFFAQHTGIESTIKNNRRRTEHLAGRFLLKHLKEDFPLVQIAKDEHDKPRINDNDYFFSISHSWPYIAVIIDPYEEAGIDIQTWTPGINNIKNKFLSPAEQQLLKDDTQLFTAAWTAKEAAYKWNGRRGVDFIEHLPIVKLNETEGCNELIINLHANETSKKIFIQNIISTDFTYSYVVNVAQN
jgi:phosphopantetheinyl transferase